MRKEGRGGGHTKGVTPTQECSARLPPGVVGVEEAERGRGQSVPHIKYRTAARKGKASPLPRPHMRDDIQARPPPRHHPLGSIPPSPPSLPTPPSTRPQLHASFQTSRTSPLPPNAPHTHLYEPRDRVVPLLGRHRQPTGLHCVMHQLLTCAWPRAFGGVDPRRYVSEFQRAGPWPTKPMAWPLLRSLLVARAPGGCAPGGCAVGARPWAKRPG